MKKYMILFLLLLLSGCGFLNKPISNNSTNTSFSPFITDKIRIESFDLEDYSFSKQQNPLNNELQKIVAGTDILAIQADANDSTLINFLKSQNKNVASINGYYIAFNENFIKMIDTILYGNITNKALIAHFQIYDKDLVIINVKINPLNATEEIKELKNIYNYAQNHYNAPTIIMGNLYADNPYTTQELTDFSWIISDNTQTDPYNNAAYERFIISPDMKDNLIRTYVNRYTDNTELAEAISSSYQIYMELKTGLNTEPVPESQNYTDTSSDFIIGSWNLQAFGTAKANDATKLNVIVQTIKNGNYDIFFVEEIKDESGTAFKILCDAFKDEYNCITSSRAGRTASKEQYGVIYKKTVQILSIFDYNPDTQDRWERPPFEISISKHEQNYTIYVNHLKPEAVQAEMNNLESLIGDNNPNNIIILGDLNAGCQYYINNGQNFKNWHWVITNDEDTTSGNTNCAYDRFILNYAAYRYYKENSIDNNNLGISDHYPIKLTVQ
jgi:hypothetical protein